MQAQGSNLFLNCLSEDSREFLISRSTMIKLPLRTMLYRPGERPRYIYLLTAGIASVVAIMEDGRATEVGMIGAEGVVGGVQLLGPAISPTQCIMQGAGTGLRIPFDTFLRAFHERDDIRQRVLEFAQEHTLSLSQIAGCHRLHEAEQRLTRWLLMVQDRTNSDVLVLTQEFLAEMLGSRRTTITVAAGILQRAGMIEYKRGQVRILDRPRLETVACGCYAIVRDLHRNLYMNPL